MKPGSLLFGLGIAGAAWYLYNNGTFGAAPTTADGKTPVQSNGVPAAGANTSTGTNNPPATPPPAAPPPPPSISFAQYIANTVGGRDHQYSADTWNWHYSNYSSVPQTTDLFDPANRGALLSFPDYMARRTAAGLSGVGVTGLSATVPNNFRSAGAYITRGQR